MITCCPIDIAFSDPRPKKIVENFVPIKNPCEDFSDHLYTCESCYQFYIVNKQQKNIDYPVIILLILLIIIILFKR